MSGLEIERCRACGKPKPINAWCASDACADRVAAAQAELDAWVRRDWAAAERPEDGAE